jgi:hypothetical protein
MFSETQSLVYSYFMDFPFISRNFALFSENYATVGCEISRNTKVNFLAKFRIAKFRIHPIFGSDQYKVETGSLCSDTADSWQKLLDLRTLSLPSWMGFSKDSSFSLIQK